MLYTLLLIYILHMLKGSTSRVWLEGSGSGVLRDRKYWLDNGEKKFVEAWGLRANSFIDFRPFRFVG